MKANKQIQNWMQHVHDGSLKATHNTAHMLHEKVCVFSITPLTTTIPFDFEQPTSSMGSSRKLRTVAWSAEHRTVFPDTQMD